MRVAILGAGAWGTTLGKVLVECGNSVSIWGTNQDSCNDIHLNNSLPKRLPGVDLPLDLHASTDIGEVLGGIRGLADVVIVAISAQAARGVLEGLLPDFADVFGEDHSVWPPFLSLIKGLEKGTNLFMTQMIGGVLSLGGSQLAALAGPNLAKEVAARMPVAATIASSNIETAEHIAELFAVSEYFSIETSQDIIGVQLLSCLKNVYALLCGYQAGLGYGTSTIASIVTRALKESAHLLDALGASRESVLLQAGVGDMIATCASPLSRNYSFGMKLGQGESFEYASQTSEGVVEGVSALYAILELSDSLGAPMEMLHAFKDAVF
jgi:glycerol-3-phosphate dehydrogenase (NAD(P)+)